MAGKNGIRFYQQPGNNKRQDDKSALRETEIHCLSNFIDKNPEACFVNKKFTQAFSFLM
jgi:hypothetical protein